MVLIVEKYKYNSEEDFIMKKQRLRKLTVVLTVVVCILSIGCLVSAATFSQTVSFAGNSTGYANSSKNVDVSNANGFKSKLVSFKFTALPSGVMPLSNTAINFRLYKGDDHSAQATKITSHSYSDYLNGTWESGTFFTYLNPPIGDPFVIASNATNASGLGATVGVQWKYYH